MRLQLNSVDLYLILPENEIIRLYSKKIRVEQRDQPS